MHKKCKNYFLPRLGAPLKEINCSKDSTLYAVHHIDNSKKRFKFNFEIKINILFFQVIHVIGNNFSVFQKFSGIVCQKFQFS
jgi:hypothetical protein